MTRKKTTPKVETVLVMRTCNADMTSHTGFVWPESGPVECPDWDANPECGHGLHGLLRGSGDGSLLNWDESAKWLVVEVGAESVVDIGGKVKFPRGTVVYCGTRDGATGYLAAHGCTDGAVGATVTGGDGATVTGGDGATVTGGENCALNLRWWDGKRYRIAVFYVGEDGIDAGAAYRCENGKPVKVGP